MQAIIQAPIGDVKPYPGNPRINDKAIDPVAASIKEFGWQQPIVVDKDNVVIVGHTRLLAAKKLGMTEVPIVVADKLTPEQVTAYRLADNRTNQNADWDWSLLGEELGVLISEAPDLVPITGFDKSEVLKAINYDTAGGDRVRVPKPRPDPISSYGDVWQSTNGDHLVICSENNSELTKQILSTKQPDCIITDPPYNMGYASALGEVKNDTFVNDDHFAEFLRGCFEPAVKSLRPGGAVYTCGIHRCLTANTAALASLGVNLSHELIWAKSRKSYLTGGKFSRQHENIWLGHKPGAAQHGPAGVDASTLVLDERENFDDLTREELLEILKSGSVLDAEHDKDKWAKHPTVKPGALLEQLIRASTIPDDTVIDIFGGSGSTALAAHALGRKSITTELDPSYVDVTLARLYEHHKVDFTNQNGELWSTLWEAEKARREQEDDQ